MQNFEDLNYLKINSKDISEIYKNNENVIFSCELKKINDKNSPQIRSLVLTNKKIYNLKAKKFRWSFGYEEIEQITIGTLGMQFIIHKQNSNDYRFSTSHSDERKSIIKIILRQYNLITEKMLAISMQDQSDLRTFQTTKQENKKGKNKKPQQNVAFYDEETFEQLLRKNEQTQFQQQKNTSINGQNQDQYNKQHQLFFLKNNVENNTKSLENYTLLKVIGQGAAGKVLKIQSKKDGNIYALKSIKKEVIYQQNQLKNTKTEHFILNQLKHPFINKMYEYFQDSEYVYFVLQYAECGDLYNHLLQQTRFSEERSKFYVAQVILALEYLHEKNIVYRDLKTDNILMGKDGYIILTDFGLSKRIGENQLALTFCGTIDYLAPEIIKGEGGDFIIDWWALGILTYEFLYGNTPFNSNDDYQIQQGILINQIEFNEKIDVSPEARNFITRLLNKNKMERLGSQNGAMEIKNHVWFSDIDWDLLYNKQIQPTYIPDIQNQQFIDPEYENQNPDLTRGQCSYYGNMSVFDYFNDSSYQ